MSQAFLDSPIEYLKGVGPLRAEMLKSELGIRTFGDLLGHFPFRYIDRSTFHKVRDIVSDAIHIQLKGQITKVEEFGKGNQQRLVARFEDDTGSVDLLWFKGAKWIKPKLKPNTTFIVFGKPGKFKGQFNLSHPEIETEDSSRMTLGINLNPVYSTTEKLGAKGLNSRGISRIVQNLLPQIDRQIPETLPADLLKKYRFPSREESMRCVHGPSDAKLLDSSIRRLKFEELLLMQLILVKQKIRTTIKLKSVVFKQVGNNFQEFYHEHLPFELTGAQKKVIKEIRNDVKDGHHMNRLVQGDVGSGKTVVALLIALLAIDNGYQACLMAPTEILANQHFDTLSEMLAPMDLKVEILTGSTKTAKRRELHAGIEDGSIHILVGTHALIEPKVKFKNLGLSIIDEQHRFGVAQRAKLWRKAKLPPHVLVMTATPIPRTLAMTVYGDLDVSVIDELPPGRKPVKTVHRTDSGRLEVFGFMEKEIAKGRQIYVVYPLIEESVNFDYKDLLDGYESICRYFPRPKFQVSIVHGRMKAEAKDEEMRRFVNQETQILVATTVIEVGVNVPNATVMVIESSERFGLSQLHQLRGRVGRGAEKSYCILMTADKLGEEARKRLETMIRTNDGFEIAEVDLEIRGPGDLMGTQQSGMLDLNIADIVRDREILTAARYEASLILDDDSELEAEKNSRLAAEVARILKSKPNWSRIS